MFSRVSAFAYWSDGFAAPRRAIYIRNRKMPPTTTSPMSSRLPKPSDKPKCDSSAARPRPAAMPAIGPSQREAPDGAAAGVGAVLAGDVGVAGCAAALFAGAAAGGVDFEGATLCRCAPKLRPPPMRPASTISLKVSASPANVARSRMGMRFMVPPLQVPLTWGRVCATSRLADRFTVTDGAVTDGTDRGHPCGLRGYSLSPCAAITLATHAVSFFA